MTAPVASQRRSGERACPVDECARGLEGGGPFQAGGSVDGSSAGVDRGARCRSEPVGDLAQDDGAVDFPLADSVGGPDAAILQEDEERAAPALIWRRNSRPAPSFEWGECSNRTTSSPARRPVPPTPRCAPTCARSAPPCFSSSASFSSSVSRLREGVAIDTLTHMPPRAATPSRRNPREQLPSVGRSRVRRKPSARPGEAPRPGAAMSSSPALQWFGRARRSR